MEHKENTPATAWLVLENGRTFQGRRFGARGERMAEVVFTTGMSGYLETLSDPSFWGQIVVQTFPLIGNYGVIPADFESDMVGPGGYIVKHWCQAPSNFRSEGSLDAFFQDRGLVALEGIDTRTVTKIIREKGVMNGVITDDPASVDLAALSTYRAQGAVRAVSTKEKYVVGPENPKKRLALMDYGLKKNIWRELTDRGAQVTVCPCTTTAEEIAAMNVDGVMLSNGPGDHGAHCQPEGDCRAEKAHVRHLPGAPADGSGPWGQDPKAEVRPPGGEPAGKGPGDRPGVHHQPEPRLCSGGRQYGPRRGPGAVCQRERRHLRGGALHQPAGLYHPVPPRGLRRAFGHGVPVR